MAWKFPFQKSTTETLWIKCENCQHLVYKSDVEKKKQVCPECGWHFRIDFKKRIEYILDPGSFQERFADLESLDPLNFKAKKAYKDKLAVAVKTAGIKDCAIFGEGAIQGAPVVFGTIDPTFIMGAMGSVTGEKIARGAELARKAKKPLIVVSGSGGGARMEEGILSLMQMAKTSAALGRLKRDGGLYIVVLTNATMGGSMASFASLGDVILAEPMALLGFTGPRVIQQTIKKEMPPGFQQSEFLLKHGFIDRVVPRDELREYLGYLVKFFTQPTAKEQGLAEPVKAAAKVEADIVMMPPSRNSNGRMPAVNVVLPPELVANNGHDKSHDNNGYVGSNNGSGAVREAVPVAKTGARE